MSVSWKQIEDEKKVLSSDMVDFVRFECSFQWYILERKVFEYGNARRHVSFHLREGIHPHRIVYPNVRLVHPENVRFADSHREYRRQKRVLEDLWKDLERDDGISEKNGSGQSGS